MNKMKYCEYAPGSLPKVDSLDKEPTQEWAVERYFNPVRVGSSGNHKHLIRLVKLARDQHSSLLRTILNYDHKSFYNLGLRWNFPSDVIGWKW